MKNSVLFILIIFVLRLNAYAQPVLSQFGTQQGQHTSQSVSEKRLEFKRSTLQKSSTINSLSQQEQKFIIQNVLKKKGLISSGGGDAGGGNLLDGRPIENFASDMSGTPEMIQAIRIANLIGDVKFQSLNKIIKSIVEKKTWYLVPIHLPALSEDKIGTPFASTQGALQDFEEVWIDKNRYDLMSFKEKVILLVHEIFMGLKIFKSESIYQQCKWAEPFYEGCLKFESINSRKPLLLTPSDYQDIRKLGAQFSRNYDLLMTSTYRNELIEKISSLVFENGGFDSQFIKPSRSNFAIRKFTGQDILNAIKNQSSVQGLPLYCNHKIVEDMEDHQYRMKSHSLAEIQHSIKDDKVLFEVKLRDSNTNKVTLYNTYNFDIDTQHTNSLTLGFDLNQSAYHFQSFVQVDSKLDRSRNVGMIAIGLTPSLNIRSLTFATINWQKANQINLYDGKDVFKCLANEEYLCVGADCIKNILQ